MEMQHSKPCNFPSPPGESLAVIKYCSGEEPDSSQLVSLIKIDPVLSAELLKVANSSYFGFHGRVQSIKRVVALLGLRTIRSMALSIAVRNLSRTRSIPGLDNTGFWKNCIRHAVISSELGTALALDKDECYTAGLLQEIGLLVLASDRASSEKFFSCYYQLDPDLRKTRENEVFDASHDTVASFLSSQWSLPSDMVEAICSHHQDTREQAHSPGLADVLYCSDWINSLLTDRHPENSYMRCMEILNCRLGLKMVKAQSIMDILPVKISEAGNALDCNVCVEPVDHEQILHDAAVKLAKNNLELHKLSALLKKTIRDRDRLQDILKRDIQIAREVQQAFLPDSASDPDVFAFNMPARELSGDFYDYFRLPDGRLAFCFGDVSGKGVNSALIMVKVCSLYRSHGRNIEDIAVLASRLNAEMLTNMVRGMFITMVFGVFDPVTGIANLINAGHLPVITVDSEGNYQTYEALSPPLGILEEPVFSKEKVDLKRKSLYLYTDGISESASGVPEKSGLSGIIKLLVEANEKPPAKRMAFFKDKLLLHEEKLHDDSSMLLIRA